MADDEQGCILEGVYFREKSSSSATEERAAAALQGGRQLAGRRARWRWYALTLPTSTVVWYGTVQVSQLGP